MSKDGYTLVEMLAALIMLGLAIGGLIQGMHVVGLIQSSAGRALAAGRAQSAAQEKLGRLLAGRGPFFSDDVEAFNGSASQFSFACGEAATCSARLAPQNGATRLDLDQADGVRSATILPGGGPAGFTYVGDRTTGEDWPPTRATRERLERITLTLQRPDGIAPLASVRLWIEQVRDCSFDVIAQACRSAHP